MVAPKRDETASCMQLEQQIEHAARIGAAVHVVAERDEQVVRFERDGVQQSRRALSDSRGYRRWQGRACQEPCCERATATCAASRAFASSRARFAVNVRPCVSRASCASKKGVSAGPVIPAPRVPAPLPRSVPRRTPPDREPALAATVAPEARRRRRTASAPPPVPPPLPASRRGADGQPAVVQIERGKLVRAVTDDGDRQAFPALRASPPDRECFSHRRRPPAWACAPVREDRRTRRTLVGLGGTRMDAADASRGEDANAGEVRQRHRARDCRRGVSFLSHRRRRGRGGWPCVPNTPVRSLDRRSRASNSSSDRSQANYRTTRIGPQWWREWPLGPARPPRCGAQASRFCGHGRP